MPAPTTAAPRIDNAVFHFIEAECIKTVPQPNSRAGTKFTEGEIYILTRSAKGNFIVDTDGGREMTLKPDEFSEIFKIIE